MSHRAPVRNPSATSAEKVSAVQLNAETIAKLTDVLHVLTGSPASPGLMSAALAGPAIAGPIVTAPSTELVSALLERMWRRMPKSGTKDSQGHR